MKLKNNYSNIINHVSIFLSLTFPSFHIVKEHIYNYSMFIIISKIRVFLGLTDCILNLSNLPPKVIITFSSGFGGGFLVN